jgi:hypothetical protein
MRITRWDQVTDSEFTDGFCQEIALACIARISANELRTSLAALVASRDIRGLVDFELDYGRYSAWDALNARQALALYTKRSDLRLEGIDPKRTAVEKFIDAERACVDTNEVLRLTRTGEFQLLPRMGARLYRASQKIAHVLGDCPSVDDIRFRYGPGATSQVQRRKASARRKLGQTFACSEELVPILPDVLASCPSLLEDSRWEARRVERVVWDLELTGTWGGLPPSELVGDGSPRIIKHEVLVPADIGEGVEYPPSWWVETTESEMLCHLRRVNPCVEIRVLSHTVETLGVATVELHHGKLNFVPKTAKTHRAIVVEPTLNGFVQLGIGDIIATRLRGVGVDIRDQTRNQRLAREGSLSGALATLDLSSASDTIAVELVKDLLPMDWFNLLWSARTSKVECEGVVVRMQKFSSMGNGFTFPLETLIFYAMACAVAEEFDLPSSSVSVYGDDIIVPTVMFRDLCETLVCFGFTPNASKSFADGPFRESCGADYLSGVAIRPFYVKGPLAGFDVFRLHNQFVRVGDAEIAELILRYIDPSLRRFGPDGYGDGHLLGDFDKTPLHRERGWCGYIFETHTFKPRWDFTVLPGDRVLPSYSIYTKDSSVALKSRARYLGRYRLYSREYLVESLREQLSDFREGVVSTKYGRDGALGVSIPGVKGCKLIKVYVLH